MNKSALWFLSVCAVLALVLSGSAIVAAAPPRSPSGAVCSATYVVRWGDNLTRIAALYGTTVSRLATWNGIVNPNRIYAGQTLCVQSAPSDPGGITYTVRWGDNLYSIARRFGVPFWDLVAANHIPNPNLIYVGQVLRIPTVAEPEPFDRVNIYLIALEDAGESGLEIGCGDSVVSVEVSITPTLAPLRGALDELVSVEDQFYGDTGLYNALYQSDLQVQDVWIADRQAVVHLTGSILIGGTCDAPRVEAQLEQTALQFSTVDSVLIYVDNVLLQDALD